MKTVYKISVSNSTTPILQDDRAQILDVLRGIAIFGILLNNIYGFSGYGFLTDEMRQQFSTHRIDDLLNFFQIALVEGKFYSLFSLLFGIGFSIILLRNQQKGINPLPFFYRRLFILFLIGAVHIYFLWQGDILLLYALIGFTLPMFRNCSNKVLLIWAAALLLSPILVDTVRFFSKWSPGDFLIPLGLAIDEKVGITDDNFRRYLFHDKSGWKEWWNWQQTGPIYRYAYLLNSNRLLKVLAMFLIGFYVGRKMIYANLQENKPLLKKVMKWGFIIGLPFSFAMAVFEGDDKYIPASVWGMADTISYAFAVVPLSLAYAAAISLLWLKSKDSKLKLFSPVGRMALTNYLMQTVICSILFYNIGFGMGQKFGLIFLFLIVIAVYVVQIIYSSLWLKHFQYGPFEWVWRQLTYGKWLPLRKQPIIN